MQITDLLNSGALHEAARKRRPDCVDVNGNVHRSPERAEFVSWVISQGGASECDRAEYERRYVPS